MENVYLTVGITTRNRSHALFQCVKSVLEKLGDLASEILIVDDTSDVPAIQQLEEQFISAIPGHLRVIRQTDCEGYIVARNRIAREAKHALILFLDDDTVILDRHAVETAVQTLTGDDQLVTIAFAQAQANGEPWPPEMQPSTVDYPCYVPSYIGFAHLMRRSVFNSFGGYKELFHFYGEEKEFCLRALDNGYYVVYQPNARIAHIPDPSGRDTIRYVRQYTRNDCFNAIYNHPWLLVVARLIPRLVLYRRICNRHVQVDDPTGRQWLCSQIYTHLRTLLANRKPVSLRTLLMWRRLRLNPPPYRPSTSAIAENRTNQAGNDLSAS